jgi:hypothetical protein
VRESLKSSDSCARKLEELGQLCQKTSRGCTCVRIRKEL